MSTVVRRGALLVALATWIACAPAQKKVVVGGKEVALDDAAEPAYQAAKKKQLAGDNAGAKRDYERLIKDYGGAARAADALFELGEISFKEANWPEAKRAFSSFLLAAPTSEKAPRARRAFAQAAAKLGEWRDALETLKTVVAEAREEDKREVYLELYNAAVAVGDGATGLRALGGQLALASSDAEKQALRARILAVIDQNMTAADLARLVAEVRADPGVLGFAFETLLFKHAKVALHVGDGEGARKAASELLQRFPQTGYAAAAKELVALIDERRKVRPNAIGVVLPLSGSRKDFGQSSLAAIQLALGDKGEVELVVRDSAGEADKAQQAVEELAAQEHVIAIIGPLFSEESLSAAVKAESYGVPIINLSRKDGIPQIGPNVFRLCLTPKQQAQALAHVLFDLLGYKRFAMLYPNVQFGVELANLFWDEVDARKGEVRAVEAFEHDQTTFMTPIKKLVGRFYLDARYDYQEALRDIEKENKGAPAMKRQRLREQALKTLPPITDFDAIFIPGNPKQVGQIAPALAVEDVIVTSDPEELKKIAKTTGREDIRPVRLVGASGWNSPETPERGQKFVEGALFVDGFFSGDPEPRVQKFVQKYREITKAEPRLPDAQAYDAAALLKDIIVTKKPASREALLSALAAVKDFAGVTGKIAFDADGEAQKDLYILTIQKGEIVKVDPAKLNGAGG